jgi:hypothetical protein
MLVVFAGMAALAFYVPRQAFIDYFLDTDASGQNQKLIDFLVGDLREMLFMLAAASAASVLLASGLWFLRSAWAEIAVPGDARRYGWSWSGLALTGAVAAVGVTAYFTFSAQYSEILRFEARWILSAVVLPVCMLIYWLVTAMWTPSLQAPAVRLSGLFRWIRRPLSL